MAHPEIVDHFIDLIGDVGEVRTRRMFGGTGIYAGDAMFALEAYDEIYLKVDKENRDLFEDAGAAPFIYTGKPGQSVTMSYYLLPAEIFEDREALQPFVESSVGAARRAKRGRRAG